MPFSSYLQARLGRAEIEPGGDHEAGAHASLTLTYTAGDFGIDDSGAIKISWRTLSDAAKPQFDQPGAANYSTAEASNGAKLALEVNRNNIRPWVNTLLIRVARGFLRAGERIVVRLGDRSQGAPGLRLQTACEREFTFKVFVDAFATYDFVELPQSPKIRLVPGPLATWRAILPTLRRAGEPFRLALVALDRWGNPTDRAAATLRLEASLPVAGLPGRVTFAPGDGPTCLNDLRVAAPGDLWIELRSADGAPLTRSNPLRIVERADLLPWWGDLHGQSSRDGRHQQRRRLLRLRARPGVRRHPRPPGQRLPDRGQLLGGDQPARRGVRSPRRVRRRAGLRVVRQHRHGR